MAAADKPEGKIGPNAVLQLVAALHASGQDDALRPIFARADALDWLNAPPQTMIDAGRAARLFAAVRSTLPAPRAKLLLADAGGRTGDYILAHRIPSPIKTLLRWLPAALSGRWLARAVTAHAWTFAGDAEVRYSARGPIEFEIRDNPMCRPIRANAPACVWHAAVFQRLFRELVSPSAEAEETLCEALGDSCCRFRLTWAGNRGASGGVLSRARPRRFRGD